MNAGRGNRRSLGGDRCGRSLSDVCGRWLRSAYLCPLKCINSSDRGTLPPKWTGVAPPSSGQRVCMFVCGTGATPNVAIRAGFVTNGTGDGLTPGRLKSRSLTSASLPCIHFSMQHRYAVYRLSSELECSRANVRARALALGKQRAESWCPGETQLRLQGTSSAGRSRARPDNSCRAVSESERVGCERTARCPRPWTPSA